MRRRPRGSGAPGCSRGTALRQGRAPGRRREADPDTDRPPDAALPCVARGARLRRPHARSAQRKLSRDQVRTSDPSRATPEAATERRTGTVRCGINGRFTPRSFVHAGMVAIPGVSKYWVMRRECMMHLHHANRRSGVPGSRGVYMSGASAARALPPPIGRSGRVADVRAHAPRGRAIVDRATVGARARRTGQRMRCLDARPAAKRSVAVTSSCVMPGSNAECPASGTMRKSASGQARCRSHALFIGHTTS